MYSQSWFDSQPLIYVLVGILGFVIFTVEIGFNISRRTKKGTINQNISPMTAGLGGLLAFILALTFSMAASRNDTRKQLVIDEANAIGTAYLRSDLLPEPTKSKSKQLLKDYLDNRIPAAQSVASTNEALQRHDQLQTALWNNAMQAHPLLRADSAKMYIESLNQIFDLHTLRVNKGLYSRIPSVIWATLGFLTFLTMGLTGMQIGAQSKTRLLIATIPFTLAFSLVFTLIIELDRPSRSVLDISHTALIELRNSLKE